MLKTISKRILLIIISITLAFTIAEVYFRLFNPQDTSENAWYFSFKCFDEGEHRWLKLLPNKTCPLKSRINAFPDRIVKTNSMGLRNPEISKTPPPNTKRILFIGDSFTMGWGVDENQAFPRLVESELNKKSNVKFETINAGFAGAGPSGYYLFLKLFGIGLNPDIVVVNLYLGNDITSRLDIKWTVTDKDGLPISVRSNSMYIDSSHQLRLRNSPLKYRVPILQESHLFAFFMDTFFPPKPDVLPVSIIDPTICIFKSWCHKLDSQENEVITLMKGMKKLTDKTHKKLVVVLIPTEFQVYDNLERKYGLNIPLIPSERRYLNEKIGALLKLNNIDYIDLLPTMIKNNDKTLHYPLDDHWNPVGHQVAAQAIASELLLKLNNTVKK